MKKGNERGAVLVVGLLIVLVLTILSMAAMMSTGTELKIAANDLSAKEAFYLAEAGVEEARSRLQVTSPPPPLPSFIPDNQPAIANWTAFIGTVEKSQQKGYTGSSNQVPYNQLNPPNLNYVVTITHKVNASNQILYWGDSNNDGKPEQHTDPLKGTNIYVITSEGYTSSGATKTVRTEVARKPPITTPAALYTKAATIISGGGGSTNVLGMDACGTSNVPGVNTTATVTQNGTPNITGSPSAIVENSTTNVDVQYLINQFKPSADYNLNMSGTQPVQHWGTPTGGTGTSPSSCSEHHIVYINTNLGSGNTYVQLTGGSSGCGILLVEGDLALHGGFQWYGPILVTGSITFTGGGGKNLTGAVLAGGTVSADLVGGDANIVYCSQAVKDQTDYLPLVTLRWVELFY